MLPRRRSKYRGGVVLPIRARANGGFRFGYLAAILEPSSVGIGAIAFAAVCFVSIASFAVRKSLTCLHFLAHFAKTIGVPNCTQGVGLYVEWSTLVILNGLVRLTAEGNRTVWIKVQMDPR